MPYSADSDKAILAYMLTRIQPGIFSSDNESQPYIAIHVRRGDYSAAKNKILGILSNDYYLRCMRYAASLYGQLPFVVISQYARDADDVSNYLSGHGYIPMARADLGITSKARLVDDLSILSMARIIITANSSLSSMAAQLSKASLVLYPYPWFNSSVLSNSTLPILKTSSWEATPSEFLC
jgi:hypothetical protein